MFGVSFLTLAGPNTAQLAICFYSDCLWVMNDFLSLITINLFSFLVDRSKAVLLLCMLFLLLKLFCYAVLSVACSPENTRPRGYLVCDVFFVSCHVPI